MSRSSSGFPSSLLSSPEYPALPLTLTSNSPSKTLLHSDPGWWPCISPSLRRPKNSLSPLSSAKARLPSRTIARSQSCMELRRSPVMEPLVRCFSLSGLHKEPRNKLTDPEVWNLSPSSKSGESTQQTANPQKHFMPLFPSSQSPTAANKAACGVFPNPQQGGTTQSPRLKLPPTEPEERSSHPGTMSSMPSLTEPSCIYNYTNHISSEDKKGHSLSANAEARRLKMKRNKKLSVNLGSLMEERLQSVEPPPGRFLASTAQ